VRDWLRDLVAADRNAIGQDLMRVQYRWPVGMPLCRAIGGRAMGSTKRPSQQPDRSRAVQRAREQNRSPARLHQEDSEDAE